MPFPTPPATYVGDSNYEPMVCSVKAGHLNQSDTAAPMVQVRTAHTAGPTFHRNRLFQACFPIFNTICLELIATNSSDQRRSVSF